VKLRQENAAQGEWKGRGMAGEQRDRVPELRGGQGGAWFTKASM
jgi:hypothetical protein